MKKIISFKKELKFKTKVCEITSISLEHIIKEKDDDLISGEFIINGEYKMTEGSINKEKYDFKLPFDIALNSNYDIETLKLEIDNFYYEVVNNEILKTTIDLLVEAKEKEVIPEPVRKPLIETLPDNYETEIENEFEDINNSIINIKNNNELIENKNIEKEETINTNININNNIFENINDNETYKAYYVYIVKEDDNIDKILDKYKITKEELELYNNIENIKALDKIIIPTNGK